MQRIHFCHLHSLYLMTLLYFTLLSSCPPVGSHRLNLASNRRRRPGDILPSRGFGAHNKRRRSNLSMQRRRKPAREFHGDKIESDFIIEARWFPAGLCCNRMFVN